MEKINKENQLNNISSQETKKGELLNLLNEARFPSDRKEYNFSFDDGNHPGDSTEYKIDNKKTKEEKTNNIDNNEVGETVFEIDELRTDNEVLNWVQKHESIFPIDKIVIPRAVKGKTTSFMIKQEKIENNKGRNTTIGPALPADIEMGKLGEVFSQKDETLQGTKATYITFKPTKEEPLTMSITATIIEYPKTAMLPKYIIFKKEIKGEDVRKYL